MRRVGAAALGAGLVLLAGVGGALVVQQRLQAPWLRRAVIASVERQSGRAMTLGRLQVRLLPFPRVQAQDLALADRPGAADPEMLRIGHLSAGIGVWPLLRHVVQLDALRLDHVTLHAVRDADGRGNWEMRPQTQASGGNAPGAHGARWGVAFGSIRVDAANLTLRDLQDHRGGALHLTMLAMTGLQGGRPNFSLAGEAHGAGYAAQGSVGPLRRLFDVADRRTAWPLSLLVSESIGGSVVGQGQVTGSLADPVHGRGYDLAVSAKMAQLADLNRLFVHAGLPDVQGLSATAHVVENGRPTITALQLKAGQTDVPGARNLTLKGWSLAAPSRGAPLDVAAWGDWRGQALVLKGNVASLEAIDAVLSGHGASTRDAAWRAALPAPVPVRISFGVGQSAWRIEGTAGAGESDLRLQGSVPDARAFSKATPDLGPVTMTARLQADHGTIFRLMDLQLASLAGDLNGSLTLTLQRRPVLSGTLRSNRIDLNRLAGHSSPPPVAQTDARAPAVPPARPEPARDSQALPWPALRAGDADLTLQAGDMLVGGLHVRSFTTHVVLLGGRLVMDPLQANGPAGPIAAKLQADAMVAPPVLSVSMHPLMLPATSLSALLGAPDAIEGAVELVGELRASGETRAALAASLGGHVGVSMTDGRIANSALSQLTGPSPIGAALSGTGETAVRCLAVHANIAGGQAAIDTLGLRTGRLSVDGHGRLGLADGALDLRLLPDARVGSAWVSLPMHVSGSLRDPHPALDPAASGGRYALSIGPGGDPGSDCTGPLRAAREGLAGPAVDAVPPAESGGKRKTPKPVDILRGLGILH